VRVIEKRIHVDALLVCMCACTALVAAGSIMMLDSLIMWTVAAVWHAVDCSLPISCSAWHLLFKFRPQVHVACCSGELSGRCCRVASAASSRVASAASLLAQVLYLGTSI
jgi:hypothetical protein